MSDLPLSIRRFCPINQWEEDLNGPKWKQTDPKIAPMPAYIIDKTTNDRYLNEPRKVIKYKCFCAALGSLVVQPFIQLINVIWRIVKLVSFYEFWKKPNMKNIQEEYSENSQQEYKRRLSLKYRVAEYAKDILRIIAAPISIPALFISGIYGVVRPYDGRKLHGNIEIAFYGKAMLGQCFAPNTKEHLFGGDIRNPHAW